MSNLTPAETKPIRRLRKVVYILLGLFFTGLAILGAFLPLLPTTPFLLLASFFFVRSAPSLNRKLLRSPLFGPFLRDWQRHRAVRPQVKVAAVLVMGAAVSGSAVFGNLSWPLLALLFVLALVGLVVVLRLPVVPRDARPHDADVPQQAAR